MDLPSSVTLEHEESSISSKFVHLERAVRLESVIPSQKLRFTDTNLVPPSHKHSIHLSVILRDCSDSVLQLLFRRKTVTLIPYSLKKAQ